MPVFNDTNSLRDYILRYSAEVLENNVSKKVYNIMRIYIDEKLYRTQSPENYQRTYELLNSLTISKIIKKGNNIYEVEVFFDTSKIHPYKSMIGWNKHMGTVGKSNGKDVSRYIPGYMEYGHRGLYYQRPLNFNKEAYDYLVASSEHIAEFKRMLQVYGITLVVL